MNNILNFFIGAGLVAVFLTWCIDFVENKRIRRTLLILLISEVLRNKDVLKLNIRNFDIILSGNTHFSYKNVFFFDGWETIKGSGRAHLFSGEELRFFITQYAIFRKCQGFIDHWGKLKTEEKHITNLKLLGGNKKVFEMHFNDLQNHPFMKKRKGEVIEAQKYVLRESLEEDGVEQEVIDNIIWNFQRDKEKNKT